jgi:hypothetical protein
VRRGFKSEAEKIAVQQRQLLGLHNLAPLVARKLTHHHGIIVVAPARIPSMTPVILSQLLAVDSTSWSGVTIETNGQVAIIYNSDHSAARQESDIMHEVSHILCKHKPTRLITLDNLPIVLRSFDKTQEDEAAWLSGCLKLPRLALLWALRGGMDDSAIAAYFGTSVDLATYRRNITGVGRQLTWTRRSR